VIIASRRAVDDDRQRTIKERGVSVAQASRDLGIHPNVLRKWTRDVQLDPLHAFPGQGQMKPEQAEIVCLKKEVAKLRIERDIPKKAATYFAKEPT
jgi:transposase